MGELTFRLTPSDLNERLPELRSAYFTGFDRIPEPTVIDLRPGRLTCRHESVESGRLHAPWPVEGFGRPYVNTSTLIDRPEPYELNVELARGKLYDVRTQAADWNQLGLRAHPEVAEQLAQARRAFSRAAIRPADPALAVEQAERALTAAHRAGHRLARVYTKQVLARRLEHAARLPTLLACGLNLEPDRLDAAQPIVPALNAARLSCSWGELAPKEGSYRWDRLDARVEWCRHHHLLATAGPLIDFRPSEMPDWLWLWSGEAEAITTLAVEFVQQAVARYRGKLGNWHLVGRPATTEVLGLGEEDQVRLAARVLQAAHQADPVTPMVIDLDRPWAEWLRSGTFQLGPLHLADSLLRAGVGLAGIGIEVAPGFGPPGSRLRDLFEFSRLLDLYSLLNQPLHVTIALPSGDGPDPRASEGTEVDASQWPTPPDPALQQRWAADWIALAVAKPFVRSVTWAHAHDGQPHLYPHAGLLDHDGSPKPLLAWLSEFRKTHMG